MAFEWVWSWHYTPYFFSAIGLLLLSAWFLVLDFRSRVHRALAVLLTLRAAEMLMFTQGQDVETVFGRARMYFFAAIPFAALYFAYAYDRHYGVLRGWSRRVAPRAMLAACLAPVGILWLVLSTYRRATASTGQAPEFMLWVGPLMWIGYAGIAILLARHAFRSKVGACQNALFLASLAFAFSPMYVGNFLLWDVVFGVVLDSEFGKSILDSAVFFSVRLVELVALGMVLWLIFAFYRHARETNTPSAVRQAHLFGVSMVIVAAIGFVLAIGTNHYYKAATRDTFMNWMAGLRFFHATFALALPVVIGYALVRHRLFDLNWRLKVTVSYGTMAAAFVAVFFVVGEGTAALLSEVIDSDYSTFFGIGGAGLLLFFLHPLERLARRLSDRVMPDAKPLGDLTHDERIKLYREQAELAWLDRTMQLKERMLLDQLRERLAIPHATASRIEGEAMDAVMGVRSARRQPKSRPAGSSVL